MGERTRFPAGEFDAVLHEARGGAPRALERIYLAYSGQVAGYLRAQGVADPEDTVSEVFIGVFTSIGGFEGDEDQFRAWLFTIAHRRAVDAFRRGSRCPRPVDLAALDPVADEDVEGRFFRDLATEHVRALCADLAPDQRSVLLLRIIADMTVDEVSTVVGKTPGAVKALQRRGLAALRRKLDRKEVSL